MNLPGLDVPALLRQYGLHPDRSLGQNFLQDEAALRQVVSAAALKPQDVVLEIGPGLGSLTRLLARSAGQVVAVELDTDLIPPMKQVVGRFPNVEVVEGDILKLNPVELVHHQPYVVVANIPYYITSSLLRHLLEARMPPQRLVLTLQYEVGERICAQPGDLSLLALSVQVYGHPVIITRIPAAAFYPAPKVDSAILRIDLYSSSLIDAPDLDVFFRLIKAGFSQKRKTIRNALSAGLHIPPDTTRSLLDTVGIDPMRRAETLDIAEWGKLVASFKQALQACV